MSGRRPTFQELALEILSELRSSDPDATWARAAFFYELTRVLYAAVKLGVADRLSSGPMTSEELAAEAGAHAASVHRLLLALCRCGFVRQTDGRFELTALGEPLVSRRRGGSMVPAILELVEPTLAPLDSLHGTIQTGVPYFERVHGQPFFEYLRQHPEKASRFDRHMAAEAEVRSRALLQHADLEGSRTIVDVGGGDGTLLSAVLERHPSLRAILVDTPATTTRARERLAGSDLADRIEVVEGDFFVAVPEDGEVYVLSAILHDWDDEAAQRILSSCRRAMRADSRLLVVERVRPAGDEPSLVELYDLMMLDFIGGRERTEEEYGRLLAAAELSLVSVSPPFAELHVLEARPA